ncbi:hypothetical protein Venkman_gp71 [Methylophilales phage Venkman EXVC282S]|nr:hypothetical protein Venkman_gp71 [Methylophilales phage Venkman EXVC282S]
MNEQLLAQIINGMRMNQQQGAFGNVTDNEMSMFSGNPMNGAVAGMMAGGGVSNPMPRINEMRNNLATAGSVGNTSDNEAAVMAQAANEMKALQAKGAAGNGILTTDELNRFVYLRNMLNPNLPQEEPVSMPIDIDGASAGTPMSQEELNLLLQQLQRMR